MHRQAPETYRIFCLGGSTTYGRPYNDTTSFAGWLRELLPVADPQRRWEVIVDNIQFIAAPRGQRNQNGEAAPASTETPPQQDSEADALAQAEKRQQDRQNGTPESGDPPPPDDPEDNPF